MDDIIIQDKVEFEVVNLIFAPIFYTINNNAYFISLNPTPY